MCVSPFDVSLDLYLSLPCHSKINETGEVIFLLKRTELLPWRTVELEHILCVSAYRKKGRRDCLRSAGIRHPLSSSRGRQNSGHTFFLSTTEKQPSVQNNMRTLHSSETNYPIRVWPGCGGWHPMVLATIPVMKSKSSLDSFEGSGQTFWTCVLNAKQCKNRPLI